VAAQARSMRAPIKITDVAAAAGVAPMTVSRVINTPDRVSPETAARVKEAIERLGYVPNLIAGGLSSRRSRMVAAVVPTIAHPMFAGLVQAFTDAMRQAGYEVMLSLSGYSDDRKDALIRALLGRRPDALLITGATHPPSTAQMLAEANIPVVEIWDIADNPIDMLIGFDHQEVGKQVATFFQAKGHDRFAFISADDMRARIRQTAFTDTVRAHGGTVVAAPVLPAPSTIMGGREALRAILPQLGQRTALACSSDLLAFGVLTEALKQGIDVPGHLAVCGFGNFELSFASEPPFTTVNVEGTESGQMAAAFLLRRLAGEAVADHERVKVPFHIIERAST
jgi:LacI family transcriptional regulator, gluconate utilization system Gnt-I transcriptional repressor